MSERKTTEFKMRVTESDKTSWQLAAEKEDIGLSEFARRAMNDRARQSAECWDYEIPVVVSEFVPPGYVVIKNVTDAQGVDSTLEDESSSFAPTDVPTSGEADRVDETVEAAAWYGPLKSEKVVPKPWMFGGSKSG